MGARRDKMRAVTRYLTAHTGIPLISWDGSSALLDVPWPYAIIVSTDAKVQRWREALGLLPRNRMRASIRYDKWIDDIDDAEVVLPLSDYVRLLHTHYHNQPQQDKE